MQQSHDPPASSSFSQSQRVVFVRYLVSVAVSEISEVDPKALLGLVADIGKDDKFHRDLEAKIFGGAGWDLETAAGQQQAIACARQAILKRFRIPLTLQLPKRAQVRWSSRDRSTPQSPPEFLDRHWGRYVEAGLLHQDTLGRLDPSLLKALKNWCSRMKKPLRPILPTKSDRVLKETKATGKDAKELARLARAAYRTNS